MSKYNKFIAAIVGGALGIAVTKFGLPAELSSPEIVASITAALSSLFTYLAPANTEV